MQYYIGVTDRDWFEFLKALQPDEVNFWRPSASSRFGAIEPGSLFLFKLHSPQNFIVGGGFFYRYVELPLSLAWEAFREKNGAVTYEAFRENLMRYRQVKPDPDIGCIILAEPFFFEEDEWIQQPRDWSPNIVRGKTYSTEEPIGRRLWRQVEERLRRRLLLDLDEAADERRYGTAVIQQRLGQGAFRAAVTDAYQRRCAITGEKTLPVLEAAHIKPYTLSGPHDVTNGLLLRADLHILFDRGYLTVTPDLRVEVSERIREEFENGREYYAYHGGQLAVVPELTIDRPSSAFIEWHNQNVYKGMR